MYRLPTAIQGYQRAFGQLRPREAKKVVEKAVKQLKTHPDPKERHTEHLRSIIQGVQREQFHTGGRFPASGKSLFGQAYEVWSEDMACVLQGTCLPGSTKYCRTKSMFGKLELSDIMQGSLASKPRLMSTFCLAAPQNRRALHTLAARKLSRRQPPMEEASTLCGTRGCIRPTSGPTQEPRRNDEVADILQATRWQGTVCYHHPEIRFGTLRLSDVMQGVPRRFCSTQPSSDAGTTPAAAAAAATQLTQRERLKRAVKDYGSTVIVFHVCISLMSLGGFYLAVSSGLDVQSLLTTIGFSSDMVASRIATGTSTFLVAYGVHKLFAPVRIAATLTCTPFIVRYLRSIGFLKVKSAPIPK